MLSDILLFDAKTKRMRKVTDSPFALNNNGNNQAAVEWTGSVLSLAETEDSICFLRFEWRKNKVEIIAKDFDYDSD